MIRLGEIPRLFRGRISGEKKQSQQELAVLHGARTKGFALIESHRDAQDQLPSDFIYVKVQGMRVQGTLVIRAPQYNGAVPQGPIELKFDGTVDGKSQKIHRLVIYETHAEAEGSFSPTMSRTILEQESIGVRVVEEAFTSR